VFGCINCCCIGNKCCGPPHNAGPVTPWDDTFAAQDVLDEYDYTDDEYGPEDYSDDEGGGHHHHQSPHTQALERV
jgi:hypothetical protein